jgi:hypothetical protein
MRKQLTIRTSILLCCLPLTAVHASGSGGWLINDFEKQYVGRIADLDQMLGPKEQETLEQDIQVFESAQNIKLDDGESVGLQLAAVLVKKVRRYSGFFRALS